MVLLSQLPCEMQGQLCMTIRPSRHGMALPWRCLTISFLDASTDLVLRATLSLTGLSDLPPQWWSSRLLSNRRPRMSLVESPISFC